MTANDISPATAPRGAAPSANPTASRSALNFRILKSHQSGTKRAVPGAVLGAAAGLIGSVLHEKGNVLHPDKKSIAYGILGAGIGTLVGYSTGAAAGDLSARIALQKKMFETQTKHDNPDADIVVSVNENDKSVPVPNMRKSGNDYPNITVSETQPEETQSKFDEKSLKLRSLLGAQRGGRRAVPSAIIGAAAGGYGALKAAVALNNKYGKTPVTPLSSMHKDLIIAGGALVGGAALGALGYASGKAAGQLEARIYIEKKMAERAIKESINSDQLTITVQDKG